VLKAVVSSTHFPQRAGRPLCAGGSSLRTSFPETKSIQVQLGGAIQGPNSLTVNLPDPPNTCYLLFPGKEGGRNGGGVWGGERVRQRQRKRQWPGFLEYGNDGCNECNGTMIKVHTHTHTHTHSTKALKITASFITNRIIRDSFLKFFFIKRNYICGVPPTDKMDGLTGITTQLKLHLHAKHLHNIRVIKNWTFL